MEKLAAPVDAVYFSLLKLIPSPGRGNAIFGVHFDHISTDSQRNDFVSCILLKCN